MRLFGTIFLAAISVFAVGQQPPRPKHSAIGTTDARPITCDEAAKTFVRAQSVLARGIGQPLTGQCSIPEGSASVTRVQVVREMTRIFNLVRPNFKFRPVAIEFDPSVLLLSDAAQLSNLRTLIGYGAVAKIGPLATGPKDVLTVSEFGDSVGFFLARMAQLTHMPSPKWTPALGSAG